MANGYVNPDEDRINRSSGLMRFFPRENDLLESFFHKNLDIFLAHEDPHWKLQSCYTSFGTSYYDNFGGSHFIMRVHDSEMTGQVISPDCLRDITNLFSRRYILEGVIGGKPISLDTKLDLYQVILPLTVDGSSSSTGLLLGEPQLTIMRYDNNLNYWFLADPAVPVVNPDQKKVIYKTARKTIGGAKSIEQFLKDLKKKI